MIRTVMLNCLLSQAGKGRGAWLQRTGHAVLAAAEATGLTMRAATITTE
jgi:hypothetical protein